MGRQENHVYQNLSGITGELALTAAGLLRTELETGADVKRARDLCAILKDLSLLSRELRGGGEKSLRVEFSEAAEELGR